MKNANGVIKKLTSAERSYYTAAEVREMMGVSRDTAYRMIRSLRSDLIADGQLAKGYPSGKIPKKASTPVKEPGKCVSMLIDEEGRLKPNKANLIGSYLYEFDKHGCPIVGNILFIGEKMGYDGVEFCGISEENFSLLETELKNMITAMKATVKEMSK